MSTVCSVWAKAGGMKDHTKMFLVPQALMRGRVVEDQCQPVSSTMLEQLGTQVCSSGDFLDWLFC